MTNELLKCAQLRTLNLTAWCSNAPLSNGYPEELGWIVPPSLQSLTLCPVEKPPEVATSHRLYATNWPVEVDLEDVVQDLSHHRCLMGQELELYGLGEGSSAKVDKAEMDEFVRALISCEKQAEELQSHLGVWEDGPHTVKSMAFVEPLEEASALTTPPYVILLGDDKYEAERTGEGPKVASVDVIEESSVQKFLFKPAQFL